MTKPIEAILIGAGQRGARDYAPYALLHPDEIRFVAVAEPNPERRAWFAAQHRIGPERQYESWEPLLSQPQMGQAALVCTQDHQHTGPAAAALQAGYDVLLEKPMATTPGECRLLVQVAEQTGRQLHICHVLRYTRHFGKMRELLEAGVLGQLINIEHRENVSFWHMAHSYVRGNWNNRERSSPMILAKCSHDFDILLWLLENTATHLSSTGSLLHYREENAPPGAPDYCLDGCPVADTCPYYAPFIYVEMLPFWRSFAGSTTGLEHAAARLQARAPGVIRALSAFYPPLKQVSAYRGWPRSVVAQEATPAAVLEALKRGPYGRCVYRCDNNVVDNQVVLMQFEHGPSAALAMHGHAHEEHRSTLIEGARATLRAHFGLGGSWIEVVEHRSDQRRRYDTSAQVGQGHGGGDFALMAAFVGSLQTGGAGARTTARQALESHLMAFAAEQARLEARVIRRPEWLDDSHHTQEDNRP